MKKGKRIRFYTYVLWTLLFSIILFVVVDHSDTRLAIYLNHSLRIPLSAHSIKFDSYRNFLCIDGDGSVAYFTLSKVDFEAFLSKQQWCNHCYGAGPFQSFPDSLLRKYPIEAECEAPEGDVLLITADTIAHSGEIRIGLYTDWN